MARWRRRATSAAETAEEVQRIFGNQLELVIDGGPRPGGRASTLVDVSSPRARLLRRGAIDVTAELGDYEDLTVERAG